MVVLWSTWKGPFANLTDLAWVSIQALPLALVAVYVLPALAFVGGAVAWELAKALVETARKRSSASGAN
jgi:hypothetical protein